MVFAGAHEEIVVCRARTGRCERIDTPGPWIGATRNIGHVLVEGSLQLEPNDLMVLFSDGVIEARATERTSFGADHLCQRIEELRDRPLEDIRDTILDEAHAFAPTIQDDMSLLVTRFRPDLA